MSIESAVDEVKKRIDIVDFVGGFVHLKKAGKNFKAPCPFHSERTPSFMVSPDRQTWHCFGACQDGGDVISFLMKWDNLTFSEALKELAHKVGVTIDMQTFEDREWRTKETIMNVQTMAAKYFHFILTQHSTAAEARAYLEKRGIHSRMIDTFQLGYAPASWDSLLSFLRKKKFAENAIIDSGLCIRNEKGRVYDRFRGRVMFPIMNARHEILGFSGRLLVTSEKQAKYVNSPESPLYHKRETLYGMHVAHQAIRTRGSAILVEGEFDMLAMYKHGYENVVAVKGSAVTKEQLMLLRRYTQHIILALDADFSGTETTLRAIRDAEHMDFRVEVIASNIGKDPDESFANDTKTYKKLIEKPVPIYDFLIATAASRHSTHDPYGKKAIANEVLPFIYGIENPIVRGHYIRQLAALIHAGENEIEAALKSNERKEKRKRISIPRSSKVTPEDRFQSLQKYVLGYLIQGENLVQSANDARTHLSSDDFSIPAYKDIFTHILSRTNTPSQDASSQLSSNDIINDLSAPLQAVVDELYLLDISAAQDHEDAHAYFIKSMRELKQYSLRDTMKKLSKDPQAGDAVRALGQQLVQVEKELKVM